MGAVVRGALIVFGLALMVAGIAVIAAMPGEGTIAGLQVAALGALLVVIVAIERQRYRSAAAERTNAPAGPGGGEPPGSPIEPRFRPTAELFIDPTTGRRMRVVIDPANGERRYVAEG